jgi:hypothetical protein
MRFLSHLLLSQSPRTFAIGRFRAYDQNWYSFNSSQGDFMGDKSPKSKAKDQKQKSDVKDKAEQKAQADRAAQAVNSPKPKK